MRNSQYGICGLCFHSPGCGVIIHFDEDNRIDRLEPDPGAPMGRILCPIADSVKEIVYSKDRIASPLKRSGPKGSLEFEPITWEEAYASIADRLQEIKKSHGPEAVAFYAGTGSYRAILQGYLPAERIGDLSGRKHPFSLRIPEHLRRRAPCYTALGVLAPKLTMGCLHIDMFSDVDNSDLILVWGTDPSILNSA